MKFQPCNEQSCNLAALYNTIHCWQHHPDRHTWLDEVEALALSEMPVEGANFYEANFSDLNISGLHATESNFNSVNFSSCKIHKADFTGSSMMRCRFDAADIQSSNFTEVTLDCSYGTEFTATQCNFRKTHAHHCIMPKADLSKSNFSKADWTSSSLSEANLSEIEAEFWMAPWINLNGALLKVLIVKWLCLVGHR